MKKLLLAAGRGGLVLLAAGVGGIVFSVHGGPEGGVFSSRCGGEEDSTLLLAVGN